MYKEEFEQVELVFWCNKGHEIEIMECDYDHYKDRFCVHVNCFLAYEAWKINFEGLEISDLLKDLFVLAASMYLQHKITKEEYKNNQEYQQFLEDLKIIQGEVKEITRLEENLPDC